VKPPSAHPPPADRLVVVFGDIEMGTGRRTDDFPHADFLGKRILAYNRKPYRDIAVDVVFNGDTFDLLKTPIDGAFPRRITAAVAMAKMAQIAAEHLPFFAALRRFLAHPHAERRVHFIVGNHDAELVFPEIQAQIRALCGDNPRVLFPGFRLAIDKVLIEHGSQLDRMFQVDEKQPILEVGGERILHISWGAAALLDTLIPLRDLLCFYDRLQPREQVLTLLPELRDLMLDLFWSYWLHDFWRGYFDHPDPTKEFTWTMLKEVAWRFRSESTQVLFEQSLVDRMMQSDEFLLYVVGHRHQTQWTSFGDRKILQAGCMRNEYMVDESGESFRPIAKTYVEAWLRDGRPVLSTFVEMEPPPAPEGYLPESIFALVDRLRELANPESRDAQHRQQVQEGGG
jgi:UDP-2,3-diacylglucosamine pyrophosphatase LpxH